jgi:hypothetical protein
MASSDRRHLRARIALGASGGMILIAAFAVDWLGLGQRGSFGTGQVVLVLMGLCVALAGLLGKRVRRFYRGTAIVLLNTVLLLAFVELLAITVSRLGVFSSPSQRLMTSYPELPYYTDQDWADTHWREAPLVQSYWYEPFVLWRRAPFVGETINVDDRGRRLTPPGDCSGGAYRVFTFGGSSMWGWGSPDWGTIAAHLQRGLEARMARPVCVVNFGEDAYVSTQEVIALLREIQRGNIPDAVVFYDGVNDVYAAYESGGPYAHCGLDEIAAKFEERQPPLVRWIEGLRTVALIRRWTGTAEIGLGREANSAGADRRVASDGGNGEGQDLVALVARAYLNNYRTVGALARDYGFEYFFFWQPHLAVDGKKLTEQERAMQSLLDPQLVRLADGVYKQVAEAATTQENISYLADLFHGQDAQVWIDSWGHVTPAGNELVAGAMLTAMESSLPADQTAMNASPRRTNLP